jgi:Concanavalin A-like lectin/glucanases superfamily
MKRIVLVALLLVACRRHETPAPDTAAPAPAATATTTTREETPPPPPPQTATALPAGAGMPAQGVLLWLRADDATAKDGKLQTWANPLVPNGSASPAQADKPPAVVPNALNGHAVVRFDGTDQMLLTTIDIRPARMPEGTIITVFNSRTADKSPLRKLYGDDDGGYDRAAGLDDRGGEKNFTLFTGSGVAGYFTLEKDTTYVLVDEYSATSFSGWVNGKAALTNEKADWDPLHALPNVYLGGTGTSYQEYWNGDLAEVLVYARKLTDAERTSVEDSLAKKYGVTLTR